MAVSLDSAPSMNEAEDPFGIGSNPRPAAFRTPGRSGDGSPTCLVAVFGSTMAHTTVPIMESLK